jgi:hypothetical protein
MGASAREPIRVYAWESSKFHIFSPSAFPASLQTSTVHVGNRTTGAAMILIKKIDVKKHFADRRAIRLAEARRISLLDASGISEIKTDGAKTNAHGFVEDFSAEHSLSGSVTPQK